ncbi:MAG: DUF4198 domain-containing protein [Phycisphaerales bacterium]
MPVAPLFLAAAMLAPPLLPLPPAAQQPTQPEPGQGATARGVLDAQQWFRPSGAAHPGPLRALALRPASFTVQPGQPVALTLRTQGPEPEPWPPASWMFIRVASTQRNFDDPPRNARDEATATLDTPGVGLVGLDFAPGEVTASRPDLRAFIAERGRAPEDAPIAGDGQVALRRVQSVKAILRAGAPGQEVGASEATGKSGQQVEIRPLMDPLATPVGGDIAVRCYAASGSAPGARLIATHEPTGQRQESTADASGIARFTLTAPGPWRIEFHELIAGDPPTLYSATLTFEAPAPELQR